MYSSCEVTCHNCGHAWVYMGKWMARLGYSRRPVRVQCPKCRAAAAMDAKNAR